MNSLPNAKVRSAVEGRLTFCNANATLYGKWFDDGQTYVVFSYGSHWPLFLYRAGLWYENKQRASTTTTRHATVARPRSCLPILDATTESLFVLIASAREVAA